MSRVATKSGTWRCDCAAVNAKRYGQCWRCQRRKPRRDAIVAPIGRGPNRHWTVY